MIVPNKLEAHPPGQRSSKYCVVVKPVKPLVTTLAPQKESTPRKQHAPLQNWRPRPETPDVPSYSTPSNTHLPGETGIPTGSPVVHVGHRPIPICQGSVNEIHIVVPAREEATPTQSRTWERCCEDEGGLLVGGGGKRWI